MARGVRLHHLDAPVISADLRTPAEDIGATFRVTARGATGDTYDSELDGAQCGSGPLDVVVSGGAGATPLLEPG